MRSLHFIKHESWRACALIGVIFAASGCKEFDPVRSENLCDGPAPISMRCPQCQTPKYDAKCALCQREDADPELCKTDEETGMNPATGAGRGGSESPPMGGAGETGEAGEGEGGAGASGVDGGGGEAGESGSGGMPPAGGEGGGGSMASNVCPDDLWCRLNDSSRPRCDVANKRCLECLGNSDCGERVCNVPLGRCQTCVVDEDCGAKRCDVAAQVCVDCKTDADCRVGDPMREKGSCDTRTFTCVDCVDNSGCPDAVRGTCDTGAFTCVDCLTKPDCKEKGKPACDASMGLCVPCLGNEDCADPVLNTCDKPNRKCVDCVDDTGCIGGANTHCDIKTQKCAQCTQDSHCPSGHCLNQQCVECKVDADCPDADSARCDQTSHMCVGCNDNAQCTRLSDTPVCDNGAAKCVECNDDSTCGDKSCIRAQHKCSDVTQRSVEVCRECAADSMCRSGMRCVALDFSGTPTGSYCVFVRSSRPSSSCNNARPYTQQVTRSSIDAGATSFCIPPSTTSCPGVLSVTFGASGDLCTQSQDCGLGIGDAVCNNMRCTYACQGLEVNCPDELQCLAGGFCG